MTVHRFGVDPSEIMTSREPKNWEKMLHAKADWQKKYIVRNEGIEKRIPEHKDSMKKNSFLQEITHPPPPPSKVKWSAPYAT